MREARPQEYGDIGELTASTYLAEGFAGTDYAQVLRDVGARAATATVLVALLEGRLVGAVTVATDGGAFAEQAEAGEAVIRMLVTDPAARGRGVGATLVEACLEAARAASCVVVRLSSAPTMTAAHRIYERRGFTRTPERDWSPEPGLELRTYVLPLAFCPHCGEAGVAHRSYLEPPRFCTRCRRRMVVQVTPTGWSARCVEHGLTEG